MNERKKSNDRGKENDQKDTRTRTWKIPFLLSNSCRLLLPRAQVRCTWGISNSFNTSLTTLQKGDASYPQYTNGFSGAEPDSLRLDPRPSLSNNNIGIGIGIEVGERREWDIVRKITTSKATLPALPAYLGVSAKPQLRVVRNPPVSELGMDALSGP